MTSLLAATRIRRRHVAAAALSASALALIAMLALDRSPASMQGVANAAFVAVGSLILIRRPGNGTGPVLIATGLAFDLLFLLGLIGRAFEDQPEVLTWFYVTDLALFPLCAWFMIPLFALFPHGTIRSQGMRRFLVGTFAFAALSTIPGFLATPVSPFADDEIDVAHPFVGADTAADMSAVNDMLVAALVLVLLIAAMSNIGKWRRGNPVERRQIGWLAFGGVAYMLVAAGNTIVGQEQYSGEMFLFIDAVGVLAIPIAVGLAIMRYGLYEIDAIVNRSLIFGALAAFIGGVYVAIVLGVSTIVGGTSVWLSLVATVIVALAFQPVRGYVVRWANRVVYGERATPYEVLQQFSRHSTTGAGVDALPRIPELLATGCGATDAAVWIRDGDEFHTAAVWPDDASDRTLSGASSNGFDDPDADLSTAVFHDGELLGGISLSKPASEPPTPDDEALLHSLASGLGLTLRNNRLTSALRSRVAELEASRERVLVAADEARRSLESDLDRGAQQTLVAVKVMLGPLRVSADRAGASKTAMLLGQLESQAGSAIASIREFAAGVYPPLLEAEGLQVALEHRTANAGVPVTISVDAADLGRYPRELESAVYFAILEAIQNTVKYAGASASTVTLGEHDGELRFEVLDDGAGFDTATAVRGAGLNGMTDRIDTVGGSLDVMSSPGGGTSVVGRIPVWA